MKKAKRHLSLLLVASMVATMAVGTTRVAAQSTGGTEKESTIKVGVSGSPILDPAVGNDNCANIVFANLYDTLVYPDATSESGVCPRVAESWEVSEDGTTYTFTLKQGIKFHSGGELTAADVVYSMDRFLTIGEGFSYIFDGHLDPGKTEAVDDYTVVFHLNDSYGPFLNALVRLYILEAATVTANEDTSVDTYGEHGDYGKNWLLTNDAGSGAYTAVELVQQDYFYAEKFDDWFVGFQSEYVPEAFKMLSITEAATVRTMMNNRELDITDTWQSTETLNALSQLDGVSIASISNTLEYNMYFNNQIPPMDDVNFRKCIASLIDYDTICENILIGSVPSYGPVPQGMTGAVQTTQYTYDLDKAKEYLAASKYADNYQDYPIEFVVNSDVSDLEKIALLLQSSAQQIGISIEISKAPWVSMVDRLGSVESSPQITMINYGAAVDDAGTCMHGRFSKSTQGTWNNGEWLDDEYFETTLNEALATADVETRMQLYADLQNYLVDDLCCSGFVCDLAERCAYQSAYVNWKFVEDAPEGEIATAVNGYTQIYADMEYHPENK